MNHKFLLPLALMFLLLPVTIQAEEDDFEEENERGVRLLSRRKSGVVAF